jgi:endogenous inhibitor of DNA gyrase (YacG/DUF329 family)
MTKVIMYKCDICGDLVSEKNAIIIDNGPTSNDTHYCSKQCKKEDGW